MSVFGRSHIATVQIKSEINLDFEQLLTGVTHIDMPELEDLFSNLSLLLSYRKM